MTTQASEATESRLGAPSEPSRAETSPDHAKGEPFDLRGEHDPHETSRARAVIWINLACVLVWIVINCAASLALGNVHPLGVAGAGAAMAISWTYALRQIAAGRMAVGIWSYTVSGLVLLLAMGLFVPELSILFTFATFIFLAYGLSYLDGRASLQVLTLTLAVALVLLFTSLVLRWHSGVPEHVYRWVNLVGMLMALSIDATMFIMLRRSLVARGQRLIAAEREAAKMQRRIAQQERLESIGQLAGGIAHDFNNLLGVIINYSAFVAEAVEDRPSVHEDIEQVQTAAQRAAALTRQLLIFGRRQITRDELVDVNRIIASSESLLRSAIGEHIALHSTLADRLPSVRIDGSRIEQILLNLSVNARDAMRDGGTLLIETSESRSEDPDQAGLGPPAGHHVCISVTDTGTGFSDEARKRAFEPFFTTKPPGRGTGLGLATLHEIATSAGGSIRIYSEVGVGSTVRVYLPATDALSAAARQSPAPTLSEGAGRTVLLVEDEPELRFSTSRTLERHNYKVLQAEDPQAAIAILQGEQPIDFLLTDVVMPGMSGLDLAERAVRLRDDVRVLLMSGFPRDLWERGELDQSYVLIDKPFDATQLLRKLSAMDGPEM